MVITPELFGNLALLSLGVLIAIFLALILVYCIGRLFGLGFAKSLVDKFKPSARLNSHYDKGEKHETK